MAALYLAQGPREDGAAARYQADFVTELLGLFQDVSREDQQGLTERSEKVIPFLDRQIRPIKRQVEDIEVGEQRNSRDLGRIDPDRQRFLTRLLVRNRVHQRRTYRW